MPASPSVPGSRVLLSNTLGRIFVSKEQMWTPTIPTTSYVLIGDNYPPEGESMPVAQ